MLGTGLLFYMLSKEIYIVNHETVAAASIGGIIIYAIKKFGPSVAAFADKLNEVQRQPNGIASLIFVCGLTLNIRVVCFLFVQRLLFGDHWSSLLCTVILSTTLILLCVCVRACFCRTKWLRLKR